MRLQPELLLDWYVSHARELPWRSNPEPWAVLVSEVMLQQTPVARVLPVYSEWLGRWPAPADLAAAAAGEAVRAWGRLGYPRRALRLHQCAGVITAAYDGLVPSSLDALLALPGVGAYTARAVASFAFGQRHPVLDTNVRRVLARAVNGVERPAPPRAGDLVAAARQLPTEAPMAASFCAALMELGALVCTARAPACAVCPLLGSCAWVAAGRPSYDGPAPRRQGWEGTDRQARGALLAVLRAADGSVDEFALEAAWPEAVQRVRALSGLLADGLVQEAASGGYRLPA